ncbi:hypothetical protein [Aquamicrobium soli]|uniref:Uncharacterized protein n=1 Tax=Aquamicrobium soli TaxID=1811518 RepID=A0ABV7KA73_9HYPH
MNAHVTPEPAAPLELADLEDLVCRVRWMLKAAWDELSNMSPGEGGDVDTKVRHLVRAANELMLELHADYYDALEGRPAS